MLSFTTTFVLAAAATVLAAPTESPAQLAKRSSPNSSGTNNGYYYQFWTDGGGGSATYTNGNAGEYSVNWQGISDFTAGKGWQQAEPRNISFSGTFSASGNYYLSIYTWSTSGENYILEDYGDYNPCSQAQSQAGTLNSDGSDYQVCLVNRGNNYLQNWSVRKNKRSSGVVTTANHYNFYAAHGQTHNPLSAAAYQIVSSEGLGGGSGSCAITVSDAGAGSGSTGSGSGSGSSPSKTTTAASAPSSAPTGGSGSGSCAAKWGQCGGQGFNGPTCCASGSTCKASNQYYSQCL